MLGGDGGGGELRRIYRSLIGLMHSPHGQGELGEGGIWKHCRREEMNLNNGVEVELRRR